MTAKNDDITQSPGMTPLTENPLRRYDGEYIGVVEDVNDPKRLMRVRVRVKGIFTDDVPKEKLPWATYKLPFGFRQNDGMFTPADVGDYVWVDFPFNGDTRRPRITGSVHFCPDEAPNFPDAAWEGPESSIPRRIGEEPENGDPPAYHTACVYKQHGVQAEIREDGALRIIQTQTGANVEIASDGSVILHGVKNLYISSEADRFDWVGGNQDDTISGDDTRTIMGDASEHVTGSKMIESTGDAQIASQGELRLTSSSKIVIQAPSVEIN